MLTRADFPVGFKLGAASSSYQIEGHRFGGAGLTHWDTFARTPGNVAGGNDGSVACDHFNRYAEDLDLAAAAGFDVWRFSTSWARIIPDGIGQVNERGLDFYDRLVDAMLERQLAPWLTLYHWELPSALADRGGWTNGDMPNWFADFAEITFGRIGDRIAAVAPINEPWCIAWLGHFSGIHAPGLRDIRATARAMHHVVMAQDAAVQALRSCGATNVGAVLNFEYSQPADDSQAASDAAQRYDALYNRWFAGGLFKQEYPPLAIDGLGRYLPTSWEQDLERVGAPVDWIGINYYTRKLIASALTGEFPDWQEVDGPLPKTEMGWEVFPDGLSHFLAMISNEYAGGVPLYVTENGMAGTDRPVGGLINDQPRRDFIAAHLMRVHSAISDGIDVRGYFLWSLLDNFEWSLGYDQRFGIVHVDFASLTRTPKASYHVLRNAWRRDAGGGNV